MVSWRGEFGTKYVYRVSKQLVASIETYILTSIKHAIYALHYAPHPIRYK